MTTSNAFAFPSFPGAEKFAPEALQANLRPVMEQMQARADLGKKHFEESRLATEAALKSFTGVKDPQAAVELIKANAQQGLTLVGEQLRASADLGVQQFHASAGRRRPPSCRKPEAFAPLAKGLKSGVDGNSAHTALSSVIDQVAPKQPSRRAAERRTPARSRMTRAAPTPAHLRWPGRSRFHRRFAVARFRDERRRDARGRRKGPGPFGRLLRHRPGARCPRHDPGSAPSSSATSRENRKSQWLAPPANVCVLTRRMARAA